MYIRTRFDTTYRIGGGEPFSALSERRIGGRIVFVPRKVKRGG